MSRSPSRVGSGVPTYQRDPSIDNTDTFIQRTLGGAAPSSAHRPMLDDAQINTRASVPLIERRVRIVDTRRSFCGRVALGGLSLGVAAAGAFGLIYIIGDIGFFEFLLPVVFWVPVFMSVLMIAMSIANVFAACWRVRPVSVCSAVISLCLVAFGLGAIGVGALLSDGHMLDTITHNWNATYAAHPGSVCSFESFFKCRGWITPCPAAEVNTTTTVPPSSTTLSPIPTSTTTVPPTATQGSLIAPQSTTPNGTNPPTPSTPAHGNSTVAPTTTTTGAPPALPNVYVCPHCNRDNDGEETLCNEAFEHRVKDQMPLVVGVFFAVALAGSVNLFALYLTHFAFVTEDRRVD